MDGLNILWRYDYGAVAVDLVLSRQPDWTLFGRSPSSLFDSTLIGRRKGNAPTAFANVSLLHRKKNDRRGEKKEDVDAHR